MLYSGFITGIGFVCFVLLVVATIVLSVDEHGNLAITPGTAMAGLAAVVAWFVMLFGITGPRK